MTQHLDEDALTSLIDRVRERGGPDLTGFQRGGLLRRVQGRMLATGLGTLREYEAHLASNGEEIALLTDAVLVNFTRFYRDPASWAVWRAHFEDLVATSPTTQPIRLWSVGCSTGEEAYTLAMIAAETLGLEAALRRVKIFATDVDEDALASGRRGVYPARALDHVAPELVVRYFTGGEQGAAFHAVARRLVVFGRHDVVRDVPLSRISLVVLRNVLSYFDGLVQARVLQAVRYAMTERGLLFLGPSESASDASLFRPIDPTHRIFAPAAGAARPAIVMPPRSARAGQPDPLYRAALETASQAVVLVDAEGYVRLVNEQATALVGSTLHDVGRPFHELDLCMLSRELRSQVDAARLHGRRGAVWAVERSGGTGAAAPLDFEVVPLRGEKNELIGARVTISEGSAIRVLEKELQRLRAALDAKEELLRSTLEQLETTSEKLQSTVHEYETTCEELSSTNDELRAISEELQRANDAYTAGGGLLPAGSSPRHGDAWPPRNEPQHGPSPADESAPPARKRPPRNR